VRGELLSLLSGLLEVKPARGDHKNFGVPLQHLRPIDSYRISSLTTEPIFAARQLHHLRDPVSRTVDGINPFHAEDPGTRGRRTRALSNSIEASRGGRNEFPGFRR